MFFPTYSADFFPILISLNELQFARAGAAADPEIQKSSVSRIVGSDGSGGGGGDVKSVQIKANIQTKIASQIAQNTNRPRGLQVTLIVMKVCQARFSQDIDETDMKNY